MVSINHVSLVDYCQSGLVIFGPLSTGSVDAHGASTIDESDALRESIKDEHRVARTVQSTVQDRSGTIPGPARWRTSSPP